MELTKIEFMERMNFVKTANQISLSLSKYAAINCDETVPLALYFGLVFLCQEMVHCMFEDYFPCIVEGVTIKRPQDCSQKPL